ncbi:MAG: PspC domain-containing protein [Clostridiales bacterium GWF2_38_85]|nr:MAG: PspC domain-containing protein [Clostridiales bacterium GWF2_38_85]HBL84073.1 PspC domain-containing protein [Clostridiales bacterium]
MNETKKLYRVMQNKLIAGVCTGIAEYYSLDVNIVRLAFIVGAFAGGMGFVVYIIAALLLPEKPNN